MFDLLANFNYKSELRESKDEILVGELVRAMGRQGWPTVAFRAGSDRQVVQFRAIGHPVLHTVAIVLDRRTGTGALSQAVFGSKATLAITAEVKNRMSDPDDLLEMYRTDLANIFKMPVLGGIKLNHELNSIFATTTKVIEIDDYVGKGEEGVQKLSGLLKVTVDALVEKLQQYKR
jgi:hypothetical protein